MKPEEPQIKNEKPLSDSEKDMQIAERLQAKLEDIKNLEVSGNIIVDFNRLIKVTDRENLYQVVKDDENPHVVLAGLTGIKTAWEEVMRDPKSVDTKNLAKKLFFIDVPEAELEAINRLINFYIIKFSKEDKKITDDEFEKYKSVSKNFKTEDSATNQEGGHSDDIENDQELTPEDKELCKKWQKETAALQTLPISGNILNDFNKFIELTNDDKMFTKLDKQEDANSVFISFAKLQAAWEDALKSYESRPTQGKNLMRTIFIDCLNKNIGIAKKFVEYYNIKRAIQQSK